MEIFQPGLTRNCSSGKVKNLRKPGSNSARAENSPCNQPLKTATLISLKFISQQYL